MALATKTLPLLVMIHYMMKKKAGKMGIPTDILLRVQKMKGESQAAALHQLQGHKEGAL